jgi:nucleoside-diphosphate-sugar epimerase
MRIAVLGAGGGLGRNVVDAARAAKHEVVALARDPKRAELPDDVTTVVGDATRVEDAVRAMTGADATLFCVNPPFAIWLRTFPPLLECAITAARQTDTRLVFPGNVWIYGPGRADELVVESRAPSPTSQRGALRAEMEQQIRAAGIRYAIVRLPEFYGPSVVSLTTRVFRAALAGRRALWPGPLEVGIELVYMPDAARALVEVAIATDSDTAVFHLPGARTTPCQFVELVYRAAGRKPRVFGLPRWLLSAGSVFDATARGAADIEHLWTHPILLDGKKYTARFGAVPQTSLADAIATTLVWHRAHPKLRLQG